MCVYVCVYIKYTAKSLKKNAKLIMKIMIPRKSVFFLKNEKFTFKNYVVNQI